MCLAVGRTREFKQRFGPLVCLNACSRRSGTFPFVSSTKKDAGSVTVTAAASVPSAAFTPLKRLKQFVELLMRCCDEDV